MQYPKHKYNIFPEMSPEEYERLKKDIQEGGYNNKFPITIFQDAVLDGWNRYRVCEELEVPPRLEFFKGSDADAIGFVMQTNKRRNITSQQWAAIAVEQDELIESIDAEAKARMSDGGKNKGSQHVDTLPLNPEPRRSNEQLAEAFNTNRQYIHEAKKLKTENPEEFAKVKSGEMSLRKIMVDRYKSDPAEIGEAPLPETKDPNEIKTPAQLISHLSKAEKDKFFNRANDIIKEINKMPVIYRVKIKQSIKS